METSVKRAIKNDLSIIKAKSVAEYLTSIPPQSRKTLKKLRKTIRALVPKATEVISYLMPTFKYGRMLVAYGAFSDHCSFFPLSSAITKRFKRELSGYDTNPGTIRFPIDKPLPASLVRKIVRARIEQNRQRDRKSDEMKRDASVTKGAGRKKKKV